MDKAWTKTLKDGYWEIANPGGVKLGLAENSRVKLITVDGLAFKDYLGTGELLPYADWRLPYAQRAEDLAARLGIADIAGLMLYSAHQIIPARNNLMGFGGTYNGKPFEEGVTKPWDLTDEQRKFISEDGVRHVLVMMLQDTETAVRWNNNIQALAESIGFGIPANNSTDPRHTAGSAAEYMGVTGEPISKWANGIGLTASFDPELVEEFGKIGAAEYRALGLTTALSPQVDLATEPRWMRFADTFGEHAALSAEMTRAYCDGFQTTPGAPDGWGSGSVNTMVKHFPGGGPCEGGRDAHYGYGKYAVYPGHNEAEHLKPFTEGAFRLRRGTGKASAVMPYYTISCGLDKKNGENVGNAYNRYLINDLLREELGYDGVVCTDWNITHDIGARECDMAGKCWGVEHLSEAERHLKAIEAGVDQFGGNNDAAPVLEAYRMACEKYGEAAAIARFRRSACRLLLNIFRTGLFENPYLDLDASLATVGKAEYAAKGYESQLKSVTMLKNKALPLREGIKVYIPGRHIRPYPDFFGELTPDVRMDVPAKKTACDRFTVVDTPEEADAALCFIESPISFGYDMADRERCGSGYVPVTLQYHPYRADTARETSLAGGDPLEDFTNRSYRGKQNTAANEEDLDIVIETKKRMGAKPVIVSICLKNPMVMAELEPYADAILVDYGVDPRAVLDVITGRYEPTALLPVQIPESMETVEAQYEDVPFDMACYRDSEGNTYDFGFGLNYSGVICDARTEKYAKKS